MVKITKSLFFAPKDAALARKISIKSPNEFRASIRRLLRNGLTMKERKALTLARTRAKLQLRRNGLTMKERKQFEMISKIRIPKAKSKTVVKTKKGMVTLFKF